MTGTVAKAVLVLLFWGGVVTVLGQARCRARRSPLLGAPLGYLLGGAAVLAFPGEGEGPFGSLRMAGGGAFIFLVVWAAFAVYRGAVIAEPGDSSGAPSRGGLVAGCGALAAGLAAGAFTVATVGRQSLAVVVVLLSVGVALGFLALPVGRRVGATLPVAREALPLAVVAGLLGISALSPRLNLFTPLTMKVMKFIHDLVHQGFETLLIPDHPFFRPDVWGWIGLLFSKDVGFWGGLVIWFAPALLILFALGRARLPSVAHIRQGARRRALLAGYVGERNRRLIVPCLACVALALSVYTSLNPMVEYWDPKPLEVTASPRGEIVVPRKGPGFDLEDGRLHKFVFRQGQTSARFFILMRPDGRLTAVLDACAICQPQGYGQGEGTVICYYGRTLIPLETVGQPGGCNPVPLPFSEGADGVTVDARTLVTLWESNALSVTKGPGGGKK